jgi:two-component system chemotaxis response regulator CheY
VVVVDDSEAIRHLIRATLGDLGGFELFEAADGEQAIELVRRVQPTLILLDVHMPRLDGLEACRRLRALPRGKEAKIVMLTGTGLDQEESARAAGADLFLTKPFSPLDLLRLVSELSAGDELAERPAAQSRFPRP